MPEALPETPPSDPRPHIISVCGTYLKPEMQSIYRQLIGLKRVRTTVYAQWLENEAMFPFEPITKLIKLHHRPKGNFILRFWFKYIVRQWPPPVAINKHIGPCHPWDLITKLEADKPDLVHVYYGHKAVGFLPMLKEWGGPWVVSFHGVDVAKDMDKPEHVAALREVLHSAELVMARSHSLLQKLAELICGTGPLEPKLREAIESSGLSQNVELLGWLSQEQLLDEYQRAHLFLHPSEMTKESDQEGIPNSMLEAMATGLPVVATLHGGIPEAVTSGKDGVLVPEKSPAELAAAILQVLGDGALLARLSTQAAASVRADFEAEAQVAKMEDVYFEAIEQARLKAKEAPTA